MLWFFILTELFRGLKGHQFSRNYPRTKSYAYGCAMVCSLGLLSLGSHVCPVSGRTTGMFSRAEIWCRVRACNRKWSPSIFMGLVSPLCLLQDELDKNQVFILFIILGGFRINQFSETFWDLTLIDYELYDCYGCISYILDQHVYGYLVSLPSLINLRHGKVSD